MALKKLGIKAGKKPERLKDIQIMQDKDKTLTYYFQTQKLAFQTLWPEMTELEEDLVDLLCSNIRLYYPGVPAIGQTPENYYNTQEVTASMFNSYGNLLLRSKIFDYIEKWEGTLEDVDSIYHVIENLKNDIIIKNRKRWTDLFNSTIQEFNPLYNVDAYEETTRTLEQDGTVSNQKTGTETSKKTGTETDLKTGTETNAKTGTETSAKTGTERTLTDETTSDRKTGTETLAKTGSEQLTYNTTDETAFVGSEATTHKKAITNEESVTTTESSEFYKTKKTIESGIDDDNVDTLEYSPDRADTKTKTGTETTAFNSRQDQTTYNTTDTIDHDNDVTVTHNTQDQLTLNTTDTLTHNTTDQLTHNTTDQLTHNTTDLESRDLLDTEHILHRRYGNIGITMSTQLLESFRNFVNYRIIDVVAADIAEALTQGVY